MGTQEGKVVICSLVVVIYIYTWKGRIYLPPTFFWATQSSKFVHNNLAIVFDLLSRERLESERETSSEGVEV